MIKKMTIGDLLNSIANNTQPKTIVIKDLSKDCVFDKFYWVDGCKQYNNIRCDTAHVTLSEGTVNNLVVEYEVSILTDKEKQYLSNIIKPFRDKIIAILKLSKEPDKEYIEIVFKDDSFISFIDLPPFDRNTMYIDMEKFHRYSLEELEI